MSAPTTPEEWLKIREASVLAVVDQLAGIGLPTVLLPYQARTVELLESSAVRILFIEKSRRIGETWGIGSYATLRAGRARSARGMDVLYISYKQEIAREFIDCCGMWARAYAVAAAGMNEFLFEDTNPENPEDTRHIKAFRIRFASGFEIIALSSAPRTLRGHQGDVIIDEAAFVDNLKELMKAALAMRIWGGKVIVCSTHNGEDNEFNAYIKDIVGGRSKYSHLKIDFNQALLDGFYQRICLVTGEEWSPAAEAKWRQEIVDDYGDLADEELFCIPTQGSGVWLPSVLVEARMLLDEDEAPIVRLSLPGDFLQRPQAERDRLMSEPTDQVKRALDRLNEIEMHAFGYDPARKADPAVMHLLAIDKVLKRKSRLTVELRNVPFAEQKALGELILRNAPRLVGAAVDATGVGMNLAEDLGRLFGLRTDDEGGGLVWPISLTRNWYNEHLPPLKTAFEDGSILLARDAEHVADIRLVKVVRGVPTIPDERVGAVGAKRHGDFAVALGLAHFASRMQWHEYDYTPVSTGARRASERDFMLPPDERDDVPERSPWAPPLGASIRGGF